MERQMKVFIFGIAGGLGRRIAQQLKAQARVVSGLVRRAQQKSELESLGVPTVIGDMVEMSVEEIATAVQGYDAIVFAAAAGGRDAPEATMQVDGDGPLKAVAAARLANLRRFILVSVFPEAWRDRRMPKDFEQYMIAKKSAESRLIETDLDWVVIRPSALNDEPGTGRVDVGVAKIYGEISRDDVAATIISLANRKDVNRTILELTGGNKPIEAAIDELVAPRGCHRTDGAPDEVCAGRSILQPP
jgi:uncharacterized protein YbjT (DUF2867 family)